MLYNHRVALNEMQETCDCLLRSTDTMLTELISPASMIFEEERHCDTIVMRNADVLTPQTKLGYSSVFKLASAILPVHEQVQYANFQNDHYII